MPSPEFSTRGLSLGSEPRGDRFLAHRIFTSQQGALTVLARRSTKPDKQVSIDLFDEGEFRIELKPGSYTGFLKEAQITRKRRKLAQRYEAFESAARLANIILSNPVANESIDEIFDLLNKGLDSWEKGMNPKATYLKCLYLYCRLEGYPVKEQWAVRLTPTERSFVASILNRPLSELSPETIALKNAIENLELYIERYTHIHIGSKTD